MVGLAGGNMKVLALVAVDARVKDEGAMLKRESGNE
jgi:hypothetical protein